jgi:hypothetical protein
MVFLLFVFSVLIERRWRLRGLGKLKKSILVWAEPLILGALGREYPQRRIGISKMGGGLYSE